MSKQKETQAKYEQRKRKAGLTRVTVWVPASKRQAFINTAKKMCKDVDD